MPIERTQEFYLVVGEHLLEVMYLFSNLKRVIREFPSDSQDKSIYLEKIEIIEHHLQQGLLSDILGSSKTLKLRAAMMPASSGSDGGADELDAAHLEFVNAETAILVRESIFIISYLAQRMLSLCLYDDEFSQAEKNLARFRTACILGRDLRDMLWDVFIAHPELSLPAYEKFDWEKAKRQRDEVQADD